MKRAWYGVYLDASIAQVRSLLELEKLAYYEWNASCVEAALASGDPKRAHSTIKCVLSKPRVCASG
eukprot:10505550-Karenia_brevis.AAC.1